MKEILDWVLGGLVLLFLIPFLVIGAITVGYLLYGWAVILIDILRGHG